MQVVVDIPEEFEKHFDFDNFEDSLERIKLDVVDSIYCTESSSSGKYEIETIDMLIKAFKECTPFSKTKALEQEESVLDKIKTEIKTKSDSIPWRNTDYDDGWIEALDWVVDDVIDKYKTAGRDKEENPSKTEVTLGRAKQSECNEKKKNEYEYYMSVPVSGRLDAHVISETPLTKEEVMQRAFESANFGELEDSNITPGTDIDELYFEGETASEEREDYE